MFLSYYYQGNVTGCTSQSLLATGDNRLDSIISPSNYQQISMKFSFNSTQSVPEPLTIMGTFLAGAIGFVMKKSKWKR